MKFKDCLTTDIVVSAPLARSSPEDSWVVAHDKKIIPSSLYKFYVEADFFSTMRMGDSTIFFPANGHTTFSKAFSMESRKTTMLTLILQSY